VRVNERTEAIALYGGETDEKDYLNRELDQVLSMMRRLVSAITRLTWVTAGYGWFAIVAPFIVAAPGYFAGDMSLGGLMMAVGAFNQVQSALRWFVDNFSLIADWRATLLRVASFRLALLEMDRLGHEAGRVEVVPTEDDRLVFEHAGLASPAGCTRLSDEDTRNLVLDIFGHELADAAIVNIGQADTQRGFFTRVLHLIEDPEGQRLAPRLGTPVSVQPAKQKVPAV
jgi:putative ATP-binding cassette transporter